MRILKPPSCDIGTTASGSQSCDETVDVVNLKLPVEMFGSFGKAEGVYPAYHMNKLHWISVLLPDAPDDVVCFLTTVSYEATKSKGTKRSKPE